MGRWLVIGATICGTACAHVDRAALATSTATLACDWGYTHRAAARGWENHYESNAILGPTPSTREVAVYFGSALVLNAALWLITPTGYRSIVPVAVTAVQLDMIQYNSRTVGGACGF